MLESRNSFKSSVAWRFGAALGDVLISRGHRPRAGKPALPASQGCDSYVADDTKIATIVADNS